MCDGLMDGGVIDVWRGVRWMGGGVMDRCMEG